MALLILLLGINQQLDLQQTLFIQSGRALAEADFNHVWLKSLQTAHEDFWKDYLEILGSGLIAEGARRASKLPY